MLPLSTAERFFCSPIAAIFSNSKAVRQLRKPTFHKKLLVMDVDGCLFNSQTGLGRPGYRELLKSASRHYNLAVWSATEMSELVERLEGLELVARSSRNALRVKSRFEIFLLLSREACAIARQNPVSLGVDSEAQLSHPSPLHAMLAELIWCRFPNWDASNTVAVSQYRTSFLYSCPQLVRVFVEPCRVERVDQASDFALFDLEKFVTAIATVKDVTNFDHDLAKWLINNAGRRIQFV